MRKVLFLSTVALFMAICLSVPAQDKISLNGKWNLEFWPQEWEAVTDPSEVVALETTKLFIQSLRVSWLRSLLMLVNKEAILLSKAL